MLQMRRSAPLAALLFWGVTLAHPAGAQSADILLNCTSCHSTDNAGSSVYPNLNGQPAAYLIEQLDAYRSGKRMHTQMQKSALALGAGGASAMAKMYADAPAPILSEPADDQHRQARALEQNGAWERGIAPCASCHVPPSGGAARAAGDFPRIHGQPQSYLAATLRAYADGTRGTGGMGRMQAYAEAMTDAEIAAIAAYLAAFTIRKDTP